MSGVAVLSLSQLQELAASVGFKNPALAAAVAMAESEGNPSATNIVTNPAPGNGPERSFGLWQINTLAHPSYDETSLLDPDYNARAAFAISNGGASWKAWSTYTSGAYKKYYRGGLNIPSLILPLGMIAGGSGWLTRAHWLPLWEVVRRKAGL